MKRLFTKLISLTAVLALARAVSAAELGEPAAPLEISEWIKGEPVDLATVKGKKVVVVEFWATWCGPCRVSIPHLTEMQKKFAKRDVIFIGVSDETSAKVKPFVDSMGDKMDYTVALDKDRKTSVGYMEKYGVNGIPHAFVVDKEGRIAWQGHPMSGLERVLDQMAANTFDLAAEKKRDGAQRKIQEYFEMAMKGEDDAKLDKLAVQIAALDKELGGIDPEQKLDLAELRKSARFQSLMRDYQRALVTGKSDTELQLLEQKAAPLAPKDFKFAEFKAQFQLQRVFQEYYRAVTGKGDEAKAEELAKKLEATPSDDAEALNEIAWTLLTDEKIKTRNLKLAMKMAKGAFDASEGKDPNVIDTYARALFDTGRVAEAVKQQKRAIELNEDADRKSEFEATLKRYQKAGAK
jgi:thiol-disulfide isomerase/thioredoxin